MAPVGQNAFATCSPKFRTASRPLPYNDGCRVLPIRGYDRLNRHVLARNSGGMTLDHREFDALARSLAAHRSRRGLLGAALVAAAGALGLRGAEAQVTQVQCGNQMCASKPGGCNAGCVCCLYTNPITGTVINSRCRPPGTCSPGVEAGGATTPAPTTTVAPITTTVAPTTTVRPTTTTVAPTPTTVAPATTTTARPSPTTCTTFEDCPFPPAGNNCRVRQCVSGVCGFRFLPGGSPCANPTGDPCVLSSTCFAGGPGGFSQCFPETFDDRPACLRPCETVADCPNLAGQCQEMACIYDSQIGTGGCQVVADPDANGRVCTDECRTCAPMDERRCIPDGTCQNGTCTAGLRTYTCSPSPFIQCCFGQKDGCGLGAGNDCQGDPSRCCSGQCPNGVCA